MIGALTLCNTSLKSVTLPTYNRRPYLKQTVLVVLERYLREFFSTPLQYDRNLATIYGK